MKIKIPEYIKDGIDKYKYIILICIVGILLMLISDTGKDTADIKSAEPQTLTYDVSELETLAEGIFRRIQGVGDVKVKITVKCGYETIYAYDSNDSLTGSGNNYNSSSQRELITVSENGSQRPVTVKIKYPEYMGAVIVCEGGDNPTVKLQLTQAMKSLTGISADNIVVAKMK